jgi:spore coat protein U-like protein
MRIHLSTAAAFGALLLLTGISHAGHAAANNSTATATANVTANVVAPITLIKTSDLSFGDFTSDSAACTVAVSSAGVQTITGNCASLTTGTISAAGFTVGGSGNRSFTTNVVATSQNLSDGAGHTIPLTLQNNAPTHLTNGAANINVFGSLGVGANQVAGAYTDTVTVTVAY